MAPLSRELPEAVRGWDLALGHARTLLPFFKRMRTLALPATEAWKTTLEDPTLGPVALSGRAFSAPSSEGLLVVHGLGGSTQSGYMPLALQAAAARGLRTLLLNTRGSDRSGQDISHAGLGADLDAALESPFFADVDRVHLFGYSLGGHLALRYAAERPHPKLGRVVAVGSPLLLDAASAALDAAPYHPYRRHVMRSLHEIYTAAYQRNPRGLVPEAARRIRSIREWDERIVAPRFGFSGAADYYRKVSAGLALSELKVDALYVGAPRDPMVPLSAVLPALASPTRLDAVWDPSAGHLGFGPEFDLGLAAPLGLEAQCLAWLFREPTQRETSQRDPSRPDDLRAEDVAARRDAAR